ncbi:MAG: CRTAC1 family protein [Bryobacteraceae bacterium]|nr:CRTAC1 family protein [Bryobacteraceae bacterium]
MAAGAAVLWPQGMGSGVKSQPRSSPRANVNIPSPRLEFRDIAGSIGVTARNVYGGEKSKRYILEMNGNGAVVFDFDNDGWRDVFLVNGTRLDAADGEQPSNTLYRNRGDGTFEDVTAKAGLVRTGWGQGACAADVDNDGDTDLFVTYYGQNVFYRNNGDGRFDDDTRASGLAHGEPRWSTNCAFLDYDRDGLLDLVVTSYLKIDLKEAGAPGSTPYCAWRGLSVFCGPRGFPGGANFLYRNEGGGRFRDVSRAAGIAVEGMHYNLGVAVSDYENDGWPDIHVACDSTPGILYRNNRDGTFSEIAVEAGVAYGSDGQEMGSMGTAAGDYDNDGWIDIVKMNFMDETPTLYRNLGDWFFEDATYMAGLGVNTRFVGWGVAFLDVDQDGWKDILTSHGHIYPELATTDGREPLEQRKALYWNLRNGAFRDIAEHAGGALTEPKLSRGLAYGDLDGDGAPEVVVINMNARPSVLKVAGDRGNAVLIELAGVKSNRGAIGARVEVVADGLKQVDEVRSGGSYASQNDLRLHFGLGGAGRAELITVKWPSGLTDAVKDVPANAWVVIEEGKGITRTTPFR